MHEKEEMEEKYYLMVVVWLGQALLPNQDNVVVTEPTFIDHFSSYIFTVPNMNRIIKDPIMKLIPFT